MEQWQRDNINKNLPDLLEYTRCHPKLLEKLKSVDIFSSADVSKIKSKRDMHEQASCFYDIVKTRSKGYVELLKALSECKQDGAVKLLIKGMPTNLLSKLQVRFLGRDHHLSELLDEKDIRELNEKLKSSNFTEYITLISECTAEVIPLLKDTIPAQEKFYVPRHLVRRRNLNKSIFTTDCQDVFVFTNCTRAQLSQLASASKCHTASSRKQIERLTSRFILLEDTSHWKDICDIAEGTPVHLITYEKDKYLLTKTTGGSTILNQFLDYELKGAQDSIGEDDVESLESETSFCVCDLPGMGKSLLFANLARIFSERNSNTITAFISLPGVAQFLQKKMELNNFSNIIEVLALLLAPTDGEISGHILALLLKKQLTKLHLYLDGLDEVSPEILPQIKTFLNILKKEKWIRIHVTARTHMRHELEAALGVIPYDIVPFTHNNKIQFLTNFWKNQDQSSNETRLADFAGYCLDKWKEHMTDEGVQISGIPLQCRLLAEVYSKHALRYARESVQLDETEITETSLLQLYNSYLKIGLARVENQISSSPTTISQCVAGKLLVVEQFHIWQALRLLYPKFADVYAKHYSLKTAFDVGEIEIMMSMGFLLSQIGNRDSSVTFVHRTFAEFLTARFFASILIKHQPANIFKGITVKYFERRTLKYFFQKVANHEVKRTTNYGRSRVNYIDNFYFRKVYQFSSYVVMKFVNDELHTHSSFSSLIPSAFSNAVSAESCHCMMISTLVQNLPHILRVVNFALASLSMFKLWWYKRYLSHNSNTNTSISREKGLLYISAKNANAEVARELYDILSQIFHLNLYSLDNDRTNGGPTPLYVAVRRGDYEVVEHVLQYSTCCDEGKLIGIMTLMSNYDPISLVQNKTRICQLLFCRNPHAKPFNSYRFRDLFHKLGIHPCLIKCLVQNGLRIEYEDRTTLLIDVAATLQADELYDLFMFFNTNVHNEPTFKEIDFPLVDVLKVSPEAMKLLSIIPSVQWDAEDEHGNNLLHISSVGRQSISMVQKCLENGVNVNSKNKFGWTCLHAAAANRNLELIYYLIEKGASITEKTNAGDTPLHLFFLNWEAYYKVLRDLKLYSYRFTNRNPVNISSFYELVTNIITSEQNEQVLQLLSQKNAAGCTILHNLLCDIENELEYSLVTLAMMMNILRIKVNETDNAGNNLLDAAIKGGKRESVIEFLRQKLGNG